MTAPFRIRPKVSGAGQVTYRCDACKQPIKGEPTLTTVKGRPVAFHKHHEVTHNGR